jgi:hypothetical protein
VVSCWERHQYTAAASTNFHAAVRGRSAAPEVAFVQGLGCSYRYWLATLTTNCTGCEIVVDLAVQAPELGGPAVLNGPAFGRRRARFAERQAIHLPHGSRWACPSLPVAQAVPGPTRCGVRHALRTFWVALQNQVERRLHHVPTAGVARGTHSPIVPLTWTEELIDAGGSS